MLPTLNHTAELARQDELVRLARRRSARRRLRRLALRGR